MLHLIAADYQACVSNKTAHTRAEYFIHFCPGTYTQQWCRWWGFEWCCKHVVLIDDSQWSINSTVTAVPVTW